MEMLNRIMGYFLVLVAVVVAIHTVIEPLYYISTETSHYSPNWQYINPPMALAILLGLISSYNRKREIDLEDTITRPYLEANILFYGYLFVGILFFWNWFNLMSPGFTAVGNETVSLVWVIIDAALPLLCGAMGVSLLREGSSNG